MKVGKKHALLMTFLIITLFATPVLAYPDWLHGWTKISYTVSGSFNYEGTTVTVNGTVAYKVLQDTTENVHIERTFIFVYSPKNITELMKIGFTNMTDDIWINKFTRMYYVGRNVYKTALWIDTNIEKGDKVEIWDMTFTVVGTRYIYHTEAKGFEKRVVNILETEVTVGIDVVKIRAYYDTDIGLLLGMKVELVDSGSFKMVLSETNIGEVEPLIWTLIASWILAFLIGLIIAHVTRSREEKK